MRARCFRHGEALSHLTASDVSRGGGSQGGKGPYAGGASICCTALYWVTSWDGAEDDYNGCLDRVALKKSSFGARENLPRTCFEA